MRTVINSSRSRRNTGEPPSDLSTTLSSRVVGQPSAVETIVPYIEMYQACLAPEGRPVGVFLLLGPSGTGKTRTVEALAAALHGDEKSLLKIDCGEFQMEHEVAKLIGAPPGYLGHRETQPLLTQARLNSVTSERSSLSIVLFDEIEKAAPSMHRLLLGVLDKAILRLGDNNSVGFDRSLIFMTSNLGAREMLREISPDFGFQAMVRTERSGLAGKLAAIGWSAVRRKFSPEFVNRIDAVVTYSPLPQEALEQILDLQLADLQAHVDYRLGAASFRIQVRLRGRRFLLDKGTSPEFGARELKRTILRHVTQPLAGLVAAGSITPGGDVSIDLPRNGDRLTFDCRPPESPAAELEPDGPVPLPSRLWSSRRSPKAA